MSSYWIMGLVVLAGAIAVAAWLLYRRSVHDEQDDQVDLPLWEAQEHAQRDFWPELVQQSGHDETMPAVLTPPEWRTPKSGTDDR